MPITVPKEEKVYTHIYDNFKGVDFTNDSTNVWHRRSPDAVNMLPDESGRPFKRHGWETVISKDEFISTYNDAYSTTYSGDFVINRCHYFELNGINHIAIFTNIGLCFYRDVNWHGNGQFGWFSNSEDIVASYDRAFFFEGNGTSAFYVYGNFKVWWYRYMPSIDDFYMTECPAFIPRMNYVPTLSDNFSVEEGLYVPTVYITLNGDGTGGETYEAVNLMSNYISAEYQGTYSENGKDVVYLGRNVADKSELLVFKTTTLQYDTQLEVIDTGTPSATQVNLDNSGDVAVLEFGASVPAGGGEDKIKVVYPRTNVVTTDRSELSGTQEQANA